MAFLLKICHPDGSEEGHTLNEYAFNIKTKELMIRRDGATGVEDVEYTINLEHGAIGYLQEGRDTIAVINKPRVANPFDRETHK